MSAQQVPEMTLGVRLYMARKAAHLDQDDIAEALRHAGFKTSRALVSMWERDMGKEPTPSQIRIIAGRTGVPYAWLVGATPTDAKGAYLSSAAA